MSYKGLGQAKWVPGQISFASLPQGRTGLPSVQPLLEAGLPIAPYIEHGSFTTGEPAIMRYGLDPYRGIMGTDDCSGLGCFLSRLFGGGTAPAAPATPGSISERIAQANASSGAAGRAAASSMLGRGVVECNGSTVFDGDAMSALAFAGDYARRNHVACTLRMTGTARGDATIQFDADGRMRRDRGTAATSGLGQSIGQSVRRMESQNYLVRCESAGHRASSTVVRGMSEAMKTSKRMLRRDPRALCRILLAQPTVNPGAEVVTVRKLPGNEYDVRFNYALAGQGLGQLTEFACSETALNRTWQARHRSLAMQARIGAALSGLVIGGIGAAVSNKNILLGMAVGGATSAAVASVWIAPHTL